MKRDIDSIKSKYEFIVIGGGINGAAVAHMAALNGIDVLLLEKDDFASGTSSKSTKLVHGGLRYLENFEFDLVREALHERHIQLTSSPHLVKPLGFIIPVYKTDKRPLWMMKLGVALYGWLSGKYRIEKHRELAVEEVKEAIPGINEENLLGGVLYYDAQMDDARLCLENVLMAAQCGAQVANHVEVKKLVTENGKSVGIRALDRLGGREFEVRARKIISTVGPWTNFFMEKERSHAPPKVRTTKGIHIVYEGSVSDKALLVPARDNRVFFIIPWMGNSLIGTTDTDYDGSPDDVPVDDEDIDYLFSEAKRIFPDTEFKREEIITAFAGLRPLVNKPGSPREVSRRHVIEESFSGIIYVLGGKYTTYRKIAEDVLKTLTSRRLVDTRDSFPLYGSGEITEDPIELGIALDIGPEIVEHLMGLYGVRYKDILKLCEVDPTLKTRICSCSPSIRAQVVYAIDTEMACTEEDCIRRLSIQYNSCQTRQCRQEIRNSLSNI